MPSLAQPGRDEGRRQGTLSRRPISQGGLFGDTVEGFAQQFSAVQQQTEAIQHILPRRDAPSTAAPGARPQSARRRGCPTASSRAAPPQAESTHRPVRRASRRRAAPPASQPGPSRPGSRRSGPDAGNPEMLEFALSQEMARTAPLLPPWRAGRRIFCFVLFLFRRWSKGQRYPPSQRKSNFIFLRVLRSMGRQCATPCLLTLVHDPFCQ